MHKGELQTSSAVINLNKLFDNFETLSSLSCLDNSIKGEIIEFKNSIGDNLKAIEMLNASAAESEIAATVERSNWRKFLGFLYQLILILSKKQREKHAYIVKMSEKQKVRIALAGETSAGKTTFCNSIFSTNIFFVTQEEATGAAVEIENDSRARVEVYGKNGKLIDKLNIPVKWFCEDGVNLTDENREKVKDFIIKYTKVGSEHVSNVGRVKVFMPLKQLPRNVVLIDTPGFNANSTRSEIAKKVISSSQACVFIIDARNALKSKEFQVLEGIREEVGKTFIVLNKMDLVMADDDLDCDGDDTEQQIVDRVKKDLCKRLDINDVMLYPVCSLDSSLKNEAAKPYVNNLHNFVEKMLIEIISQKIEFLMDTYAKESIAISNTILNFSKTSIADMKKQKNQLEESKPKNFDAAIEDIWSEVVGNYKIYIEDYKNYMINCAGINLDMATASFLNWVNSQSKSRIRKDAQQVTQQVIEMAVEKIEKEREEKLKELSTKTIHRVVEIIQGLYDGLPFQAKFNPNKLLSLASSNAIIDTSSVRDAMRSINSGKGTAAKGAIIGAIAFGPVGGLIGGALGSLFGDSLATVREKINSGFATGMRQIKREIISDYDNDTRIDSSTSFASRLHDVLISELNDYVKFINDNIAQTTNNIILLEKELQIVEERSYEINDVVLVLNNWRSKMRIVS